MDAALTSGALENAVKNCQKLPEIFNTDQGSQFTVPRRDNREESRALDFTIIAGELGRGTVGL
jgi:hypothetical protein